MHKKLPKQKKFQTVSRSNERISIAQSEIYSLFPFKGEAAWLWTSTYGGKVTGTNPLAAAFGGGLFKAAMRAWMSQYNLLCKLK